jgi:hypothetical protein
MEARMMVAMNSRGVLGMAAATALVAAWAAPATAADRIYSTRVDGAEVKLFLPENIKVYRGLLVHVAHHRMSPTGRWPELCRALEFGHIVVSIDMKGGRRREKMRRGIDEGLKLFAEKSGQPELPHLPMMGVGHSAGGMVIGTMLRTPERTLTACVDCGWISDPNGLGPAAKPIPWLFTIGAIPDAFNMIPGIENHFVPARRDGWLYGIGFEWGKAHSWANVGPLYMSWLQAVVDLRLPKDASAVGGPVKLRDIREQDGWLGDRATWDTYYARIASWSEYTGEKAVAVWLPNRAAAYVWRAYQAKDSPVSLILTAGDGSGRIGPFRVNREFQLIMGAGADLEMSVEVGEGTRLKSVRYYREDKLLGESTAAPWTLTWKNVPQGCHPVLALFETADGRPGTTNPMLVIGQKKTEFVEIN